MELLFKRQDRLLEVTPMQIVRQCAQNINWDARMLAIRGPKGVGKSTMMLQYIKSHYAPLDRQVLYVSCDSNYFANHSLLDLAEQFYLMGGKHLFLDEVHKYENWSGELKEIYDSYPSLRVAVSGSSLLSMMEGDADLSRRCINHDIQGLSFREFLHFYKGIDLPQYTLEQVLTNPSELIQKVNAVCRPVAMFHEYLQFGYYPYYLDNAMDYYVAIEQVVNRIIDDELPRICKVELSNTRKIKALLTVIANSEPYEVDITRFSAQSGLKRDTIVVYLNYMHKAKLLNLLYCDLKNVKRLQKPDKIYLDNPNLLYVFGDMNVRIGTVRETYVVNQLCANHVVEFMKKQGDFKVDGKYLLEVGGEGKDFTQIASVPNSYILADNLETSIGNKLPLWSIGFMY